MDVDSNNATVSPESGNFTEAAVGSLLASAASTLLMAASSTFLPSSEPSIGMLTAGAQPLCRSRREMNSTEDQYNLPKEFFNLASCYRCAGYMRLNNSFSEYPDPENVATLDFHCDEQGYTSMECSRWKQCCFDAVDCCNRQIASKLESITSTAKQCPLTWDGFSCIPRTAAGQEALISCPNYLYFDMDPGPFEVHATKECSSSGEWTMNAYKGGEYTDYLPCIQVGQEWDRELNSFKIICECISIFTLATSIFCFLYCRQLRKQSTYRVHTQMFLAMFLYTVSCLLRETIVHHFMHVNQFPPGCETITMLVRLFMITAYSAMSVEAFYLHWNVASPFTPLQSLRVLFAVGWSLPVLIISIYIPLRVVFGEEYNANCWINPWGHYEFIIYGPNFACLALNVIFLISLFRITCRLQSVHTAMTVGRREGRRASTHPCEILKRREFRAMITFTLLFGVPQALVLIRPTGLTGVGFKIYEMMSVALQMLQGTFASILLCYLNAEVRTVFVRTALGHAIERNRVRYESVITSVSTRVRNSMASMAAFDRRSFARRSKNNSGARSSGDSAASVEMTPMLRTPTNSTSARPQSAGRFVKQTNSNPHHHRRPNQIGLSSTGGSLAGGSGMTTPDQRLSSSGVNVVNNSAFFPVNSTSNTPMSGAETPARARADTADSGFLYEVSNGRLSNGQVVATPSKDGDDETTRRDFVETDEQQQTSIITSVTSTAEPPALNSSNNNISDAHKSPTADDEEIVTPDDDAGDKETTSGDGKQQVE